MWLSHILHNGLYKNMLASFQRNVRLSEKTFVISTFLSNMRYDYPKLHNTKFFYNFYNQLNYVLVHYFAESKTIKSNVNKFLSKLLIALLTQKLFY